MTDYETGRLYSGVVYNKRKRLVRIRGSYIDLWFDMELGYLDEGDVTDVRGPLVVLDLDPTEAEIVRDFLARSIRPSANKAADQIEEQTRSPLKIGWHEIKDCRRPLHWDGRHWSIGPWADCPTASQEYAPTHYIGPASGARDNQEGR